MANTSSLMRYTNASRTDEHQHGSVDHWPTASLHELALAYEAGRHHNSMRLSCSLTTPAYGLQDCEYLRPTH